MTDDSDDSELKEIAKEVAEAKGRLETYAQINYLRQWGTITPEDEALQMRAEAAYAKALARRNDWIKRNGGYP